MEVWWPERLRSSYRLVSSTVRRIGARTTWVPTPALAHEHALVHEQLDGLAHRRPGDAELVGPGHLVGDAVAGHELALVDGALELLGHLEVERHRAGAVEHDVRLRHAVEHSGADVLTYICLDKLLTSGSEV